MKFPGQRWLRISLRTVHLLSVMLLGGSVFGRGEVDPIALAVLVMSGSALVVDEIVRYGPDVFRWASFWAVVVKICMLLIGGLYPRLMPHMMIGAVIVGGFISHAPGAVRQHAFIGKPGPCAVSREERARR